MDVGNHDQRFCLFTLRHRRQTGSAESYTFKYFMKHRVRHSKWTHMLSYTLPVCVWTRDMRAQGPEETFLKHVPERSTDVSHQWNSNICTSSSHDMWLWHGVWINQGRFCFLMPDFRPLELLTVSHQTQSSKPLSFHASLSGMAIVEAPPPLCNWRARWEQ